MRILFLTYGLPHPMNSGARIRDAALLRHTAGRHRTALLSLLECPEEARHLPSLRAFCDPVRAVAQRPRTAIEHAEGLTQALIRHRPLATHPFFYPELAAILRRAVASWRPDILQIEHSFLAPYVGAIPPAGRPRTILSFHNIGARQYRRMLRLQTGPFETGLFFLKWLVMLRWETRAARAFDHCITVSESERQWLRKRSPGLPVTVIENGVDTKRLRPLADAGPGNVLVFVGTMGYPPNVDAVLHFHDRILPRIRERVPDARLLVVGRSPAPALERLAFTGGITLTGDVPDPVPYYAGARVCVVPLRGGGGTRLKILESMALGKPVVSTSLGCEGLQVRHGEEILVADAPREFARSVANLLESPALRHRISTQARDLVEHRYDWSRIGEGLLGLYERIAGKPPQPETGRS